MPAQLEGKINTQVFERIDLLYRLNVQKHLGDISAIIVRRYAGQLANLAYFDVEINTRWS